MAITNNTADNERYKFVESDDVAGQPGVVVLNPDGSNVGSDVTVTNPDGSNVGSDYAALDPINDGVTAYQSGDYITTISTATTTAVAAFPCIVKEIRVIGGTLGNVTVYDNTAASGTAVIPTVSPDKGQLLLGAGANFAVGCTVVTAAATIVTVIWRAQ